MGSDILSNGLHQNVCNPQLGRDSALHVRLCRHIAHG